MFGIEGGALFPHDPGADKPIWALHGQTNSAPPPPDLDDTSGPRTRPSPSMIVPRPVTENKTDGTFSTLISTLNREPGINARFFLCFNRVYGP